MQKNATLIILAGVGFILMTLSVVNFSNIDKFDWRNLINSMGSGIISAVLVYVMFDRRKGEDYEKVHTDTLEKIIYSKRYFRENWSGAQVDEFGRAICQKMFGSTAISDAYWSILCRAANVKVYRERFRERIVLENSNIDKKIFKCLVEVGYSRILNPGEVICIEATLNDKPDHTQDVFESDSEFSWSLLLPDAVNILESELFVVNNFQIRNLDGTKLFENALKLENILVRSETGKLIRYLHKVPNTFERKPVLISYNVNTYQENTHGFISIGVAKTSTNANLTLDYSKTNIEDMYVLPYLTRHTRPEVGLTRGTKSITVQVDGGIAIGGGVVFTWSSDQIS